jgi:hypothetical protein
MLRINHKKPIKGIPKKATTWTHARCSEIGINMSEHAIKNPTHQFTFPANSSTRPSG